MKHGLAGEDASAPSQVHGQALSVLDFGLQISDLDVSLPMNLRSDMIQMEPSPRPSPFEREREGEDSSALADH